MTRKVGSDIPHRDEIAVPQNATGIIPIGWRPVGGADVIAEFGSIAITNAGIITPATMPTYRDLEYAERLAFEMGNASTWIIADIALYAAEIEGYEALLDHYKEGYINNLRSVARAWPHNTRWPEIPYSWHSTLNPLMVGARRARENGNDEEAEWLASVAYTWLADALRLGWLREELEREFRTYTLPPSMRNEPPPLPDLGEPQQIVLREPRYSFSLAYVRDAVAELAQWAKYNDCPPGLLEKVLRALGMDKLGVIGDDVEDFGNATFMNGEL